MGHEKPLHAITMMACESLKGVMTNTQGVHGGNAGKESYIKIPASTNGESVKRQMVQFSGES